jgi:hypothetical protein
MGVSGIYIDAGSDFHRNPSFNSGFPSFAGTALETGET